MKKIILLLTLSLAMTACGVEQVDTGYRGIETRFGEIQGEPLVEGLHFYNPFTSDIMEYEVREDKIEGVTSVFTADTQRADIQFALTWYPEPTMVHSLYKSFGRKYEVEKKVVTPSTLGSLKDAIGQIKADDLVSKRDVATKNALIQIREALKDRHIVVTDLQFTNIDFDDSYEQAVISKVVAIQRAQEAKNQTLQVEEQSKQIVLTAKADAEAMRIKSQALAQNKGLVDYEIAQKWDGALPQYMFGNSVPMLDLKGLGKK